MLEHLPDQVNFRATGLGVLLSRWYLSFNTGVLFNSIADDSTFEDFLDIFAGAEEWGAGDMRLKQGDKVSKRERAGTRWTRRASNRVLTAPCAACLNAQGALNPLLVVRRRKKAPVQSLVGYDEEGMPLQPQAAAAAAWAEELDEQLPYPPVGRRVMTPVSARKLDLTWRH